MKTQFGLTPKYLVFAVNQAFPHEPASEGLADTHPRVNLSPLPFYLFIQRLSRQTCFLSFNIY